MEDPITPSYPQKGWRAGEMTARQGRGVSRNSPERRLEFWNPGEESEGKMRRMLRKDGTHSNEFRLPPLGLTDAGIPIGYLKITYGATGILK